MVQLWVGKDRRLRLSAPFVMRDALSRSCCAPLISVGRRKFSADGHSAKIAPSHRANRMPLDKISKTRHPGTASFCVEVDAYFISYRVQNRYKEILKAAPESTPTALLRTPEERRLSALCRLVDAMLIYILGILYNIHTAQHACISTAPGIAILDT